MEATYSSETSVFFQRTTERCISEDMTFQNSAFFFCDVVIVTVQHIVSPLGRTTVIPYYLQVGIIYAAPFFWITRSSLLRNRDERMLRFIYLYNAPSQSPGTLEEFSVWRSQFLMLHFSFGIFLFFLASLHILQNDSVLTMEAWAQSQMNSSIAAELSYCFRCSPPSHYSTISMCSRQVR
jgi:hypothetical protein